MNERYDTTPEENAPIPKVVQDLRTLSRVAAPPQFEIQLRRRIAQEAQRIPWWRSFFRKEISLGFLRLPAYAYTAAAATLVIVVGMYAYYSANIADKVQRSVSGQELIDEAPSPAKLSPKGDVKEQVLDEKWTPEENAARPNESGPRQPAVKDAELKDAASRQFKEKASPPIDHAKPHTAPPKREGAVSGIKSVDAPATGARAGQEEVGAGMETRGIMQEEEDARVAEPATIAAPPVPVNGQQNLQMNAKEVQEKKTDTDQLNRRNRDEQNSQMRGTFMDSADANQQRSRNKDQQDTLFLKDTLVYRKQNLQR